MASTFRYDETFEFAVDCDILWAALTDTERFPAWWPWLRTFDTQGIVPGAVAQCAIRGPLPYTLVFDVHIEAVEVGREVATRVSGDLEGPARLRVSDDGAARWTWDVALRMPVLSAASFVARPLLVWAHDRVVSNGVEQFRRHALTPQRDPD